MHTYILKPEAGGDLRCTNLPQLYNDGDTVLADDGQVLVVVRKANAFEAFCRKHEGATNIIHVKDGAGVSTLAKCHIYYFSPYRNSESIGRADITTIHGKQIDARIEAFDFTDIRLATEQEKQEYERKTRVVKKAKTLRDLAISKPSDERMARMRQELLEAELQYALDAQTWIDANDNFDTIINDYKNKTEEQAELLRTYAYIEKVDIADDLTVSVVTKPLAIDKIRGDRAEEYTERIALPVDIGVFVLDFNLLGTQGVKVVQGHAEHPHISSDKSICFGNMREALLTALKNRDIVSAMEITHEVLTTFSCDNPYWHCETLFGLDD